MRTSTWLRWVHFIVGLSISFYFFAMPSEGWSDGFNNLMKVAVGFVFWTGVIRWQLPRYRRWRASRGTASAS